jgi:hypothetical protein
MKDEPRQVIRVLKAFKTEAATYDFDEVYSVRLSLAKEFVAKGLVEFVIFDEDEEEDEVETSGTEWRHPDLGVFHFDDFGWVNAVPVPAFKAFNFGAKRLKSPDTRPLLITANSPDELPSPAAVEIAKRVVENQAQLAGKVADALWADFSGTGPNSGMYWHGDLDQVVNGLESGEAPRSAKDLFKLLRLTQIRVHRANVTNDTGLYAELVFDAEFEEEHGVGILTDGSKILGIGYSGDMTPFDSV